MDNQELKHVEQILCNDNKSNYGVPKFRSLSARVLSEEEQAKLSKQDNRIVVPFAAANLENNAQKHWDQFYKRNSTKFFKDRHWTTLEFQEFLGSNLDGLKLLEVGCGVGNLLFPLIKECPSLEIFACDFSPRAVDFVKANELYHTHNIKAFQADITSSNLREEITVQVDIATMVFVLSAIHPTKFVKSIENIADCLKPGGYILFRDYAMHDMTHIRFKAGSKISNNFYCRQDGTRTYFFSIEELTAIASAAGLEVIECYYLYSRTINKKEHIDVPRVFIQAKFKKP